MKLDVHIKHAKAQPRPDAHRGLGACTICEIKDDLWDASRYGFYNPLCSYCLAFLAKSPVLQAIVAELQPRPDAAHEVHNPGPSQQCAECARPVRFDKGRWRHAVQRVPVPVCADCGMSIPPEWGRECPALLCRDKLFRRLAGMAA